MLCAAAPALNLTPTPQDRLYTFTSTGCCASCGLHFFTQHVAAPAVVVVASFGQHVAPTTRLGSNPASVATHYSKRSSNED